MDNEYQYEILLKFFLSAVEAGLDDAITEAGRFTDEELIRLDEIQEDAERDD